MSWLHRLVDKYYRYRDYARPTTLQALLFLISEIGELAEAYLYHHHAADIAERDFLRQVAEQGRVADALVSGQNAWVRNGDRKKAPVVADEVADVLMMLVVFAESLSIDVVQALLAKMHKKGFQPDDLQPAGTSTHTGKMAS